MTSYDSFDYIKDPVDHCYRYIDADEMPGCCGVLVISDFPARFSAADVKAAIIRHINEAKAQNLAMCLATTITKQGPVNELLESLGFHSTPFLRRADGNGNAIKLWILPLNTRKRKKKAK
jgi:hypothetical protein